MRPTDLVRGAADDVATVARGWRWGRRPLVPRSAAAHQLATANPPFPTAWARKAAAVAVRDAVQAGVMGPLVRAEVATSVSGTDVLTGLRPPVLFVSNHASHLDTLLVLTALPAPWRRRTAVAAAADYFFDTWWRAASSALVFNAFPIERRSGQLETTPGDLLAQGWNLVVFPEGTRSTDGWMGRFRLGAAYLATRHQVPVVPVAIRGSYAAMPRGRGWPLPGRPPVSIRFGPAVHPGATETPREMAPRLESAVAALLDEDASTWWQARQRLAAGGTPAASGPAVAQWRRVWESSRLPEQPRTRRAWAARGR